MPGSRHQTSRGGPHLSRPGVGRTYRVSAKRIRRTRWQDHTPREFVALIVIGTAIVLALIAWFITHPESGHHHDVGHATVGKR